jgi:hypothetical protein
MCVAYPSSVSLALGALRGALRSLAATPGAGVGAISLYCRPELLSAVCVALCAASQLETVVLSELRGAGFGGSAYKSPLFAAIAPVRSELSDSVGRGLLRAADLTAWTLAVEKAWLKGRGATTPF